MSDEVEGKEGMKRLSLIVPATLHKKVEDVAKSYPNGNKNDVINKILEAHFAENPITSNVPEIPENAVLIPLEVYAQLDNKQPRSIIKAISENRLKGVTYGAIKYVIVDEDDQRNFLVKLHALEEYCKKMDERLSALENIAAK